jgi:hypothetical protein
MRITWRKDEQMDFAGFLWATEEAPRLKCKRVISEFDLRWKHSAH